MKKLLLLIALCVCFSLSLRSQDNPISGVYATLSDYREQKLSHENVFGLKEVIVSDTLQRFYYRPETLTASSKKPKILKKSWGMLFDGELYLNTLSINNIFGFTPVETTGRYLFLRVRIPEKYKHLEKIRVSPEDMEAIREWNDKINRNAFFFGVVGAAVSASNASRSNTYNHVIPVVVDTETDQIYTFTDEYAKIMAWRHPEVPYRLSGRLHHDFSFEDARIFMQDINNAVEGNITYFGKPVGY